MKWLSWYKFKKMHVLYVLLVIILFFVAKSRISFTDYNLEPESVTNASSTDKFVYDLKLDPTSPWPKFRANSLQTGRTSVVPVITNLKPWQIETGKGIFSSPVIDSSGTVYIGSGDHTFYAISETGEIKWSFLTDEIIDSSGLLDSDGNVYVGSGDGSVYAFNRETGKILWKFKAHTPEEVTKEFDIKTYNVNWFEGNIGMLPNGNLLAPNDNYLIYEIERATGKRVNQFLANEMVWSLPAVNTKTNRLFFGSNYVALKNTFSYDLTTGKKIWSNGGLGSNAASALLTSTKENGAVIIAGYDGYVRAYAQNDGFQIWKFATRDHIYSSPAQLSDGTIIQASVDGTIYALNPTTGKQVWAFDTEVSIRSSPAIDGNDNIYIGTGDGKLLVLNKNGTFRWAYQCIEEERNDMNASPAIGPRGIYIAGESGGIFFVPFDYPLTEEGKNNPRSITEMPKTSEGANLILVNAFGNLLFEMPEQIDANRSLTFLLVVKQNGNTLNAVIDKESVQCNFSDGRKAKVNVSAEGRFLTIIPDGLWANAEGGELSIEINGKYKTNLTRFGLKQFGGNVSGSFSKKNSIKVNAFQSYNKLPYQIPTTPGDDATVFEYGRLAAPYPTILPSYNQIGFESLRYHLGIVEAKENKAILWGIQAKQLADSSIANPEMDDRFPLVLEYNGGLLTLTNEQGFLLDFNGTWQMPYTYYRLATKTDSVGNITQSASINALVNCDEIDFYGYFLKLNGFSDFTTGIMNISGGANLRVLVWENVPMAFPEKISLKYAKSEISATIINSKLKKSDGLWSILLVNAATGIPVNANYGNNTLVETDEKGFVNKVTLKLENIKVTKFRVYVLLNTYPFYKEEISL